MRLLITGSTGTLGRALIRFCKTNRPYDQVIAFSRDEVKQAALYDEFGDYPKLFLGDVRDSGRISMALRGVDAVVHAAALKRVDAGAYSPSEMIATNVLGTMNVINAAILNHVRKVVFISSDKACVDYHAPVSIVGRTPTKAISAIVRERENCLVRSLTGRGVVPARVIGWFKNKLDGREMIGVGYEYGDRPRGLVARAWVTSDHPVLTTSGWIEAGDLGPQHRLVTADSAASGGLLGMIIGCLLGDACGKHSLRFGQCLANREWLDICRSALSSMNATGIVSNKARTFATFSVPQNAFTRWLDARFYPDGTKIVPRELVSEHWCPELLAAWYLDDGCLAGRQARIATHGFSESDVDWIASFLTSRGIAAYRYRVTINGKSYCELRFTRSGSTRLYEIIGRYVPPTMRHKVPQWVSSYEPYRWRIEDSIEQFIASPDVVRLASTPDGRLGRKMGIRRVKASTRTKRNVYCLAVELAQNFIVNGVVLHNCAPSNIYGMSKGCAEMFAVHANSYGYPSNTKIAVVRYGNVLGSRGSVVQRWLGQIARREPMVVTDRRMSRFVITVEQAVGLVFYALEHLQGGEIIVPVLPSTTLASLAVAVAPTPDYPITEMGLRPGGEKLGESLLNEEEPRRTYQNDGYYLVAPSRLEWTTEVQWPGKPISPEFIYRSDQNDHWLTAVDLRKILAVTETMR